MFDLKLGVAKNPRTIGTSKEEQVGVKIPEGDIENPADEGVSILAGERVLGQDSGSVQKEVEVKELAIPLSTPDQDEGDEVFMELSRLLTRLGVK
jgi:hypothetical protein